MKLPLSLNAINLIVTGAMSTGVVGITIATAINDNGSEPESSEVMNEVEVADEPEAEKATGEKATEQEKREEREDNQEPATAQNNTAIKPNATAAPTTNNNTSNTTAPTTNNNCADTNISADYDNTNGTRND